MDLGILAQLLAAALGGGGFSFVLGKLIDRGHAREQGEIARLRKDIDDAKEDLLICKDAHDNCETRLNEISERLRAVEASTPSYLARWVKDQNKRLLWLNDRAYLMLFAPLGLSRHEVMDRDFGDLFGEGSGEAVRLIDDLDVLALKRPGEVQSALMQLHPSLPIMAILKVAFIGDDGLLRYEGCAYVPNGLADSISAIRAHQATDAAARRLFQGGESNGAHQA